MEVNGNEMEYLDGLGLFSKIWGTVCTAVGGGASVVAGVCSLLAPKPTELSKVIGVIGIVSGVTIIGNIVAIWR